MHKRRILFLDFPNHFGVLIVCPETKLKAPVLFKKGCLIAESLKLLTKDWSFSEMGLETKWKTLSFISCLKIIILSHLDYYVQVWEDFWEKKEK